MYRAKIRFTLKVEGDYVEIFLKVVAKSLFEAVNLAEAFCAGYESATGLQAVCDTVTNELGVFPGINTYSLTEIENLHSYLERMR